MVVGIALSRRRVRRERIGVDLRITSAPAECRPSPQDVVSKDTLAPESLVLGHQRRKIDLCAPLLVYSFPPPCSLAFTSITCVRCRSLMRVPRPPKPSASPACAAIFYKLPKQNAPISLPPALVPLSMA